MLHILQVLYVHVLWWSVATSLATSFSRCKHMWFLSMRLRQGSGICYSSSRKYPRTKDTN